MYPVLQSTGEIGPFGGGYALDVYMRADMGRQPARVSVMGFGKWPGWLVGAGLRCGVGGVLHGWSLGQLTSSAGGVWRYLGGT